MSALVLDRDYSDPDRVRRQIHHHSFRITSVYDGGICALLLKCSVVKEKAKKHEGTLDSRHTIEDAETKEEALEILRNVKRRRREGKSTFLP